MTQDKAHTLLFDDLCKIMIPAVAPIVSHHLLAELGPDDITPEQEEIDEAARDCGKMLASAWLEVMRQTIATHTAAGPVLLSQHLLPPVETIEPPIYGAMLESVSGWRLTETNVHYALNFVAMMMFTEQQTNFFLPFRMVLHQTASGYALSRRQI